MISDSYEASLQLLKKQIQSGKYCLHSKIRILAINNKFVGYCDADMDKNGIETTAGELLVKLESIVGRKREH